MVIGMNIFKEACDYLSKEPNRQNIDMSLKNTHVKGMYSIVLNIDNEWIKSVLRFLICFGGFAAGPAAPIPLPLAQYAGIAYKLPTVPAGSLCSPWKHDTI